MTTIRTHPTPIHTEVAYKKLFDGANDELIRGEASTLYLYGKYAPRRIAQRSPDARLIALLRHPVERAYSQFLHHVRDTHETTEDFVEAFENESERLDRGPFWHYRRMGHYYGQLKRYYEHFSKSQIKVYLMRDLTNDTRRVWKDVLNFLNVEPSFELPEAENKKNSTGLPKNRLMHTILSLPWRFPILREIVQRIPQSVRNVLSSLRKRNINKPKMNPDLRIKLTSRYFEEDIRLLQVLIDRDLTHWLRRDKSSSIDGK
jgi:hypothetical protein